MLSFDAMTPYIRDFLDFKWSKSNPTTLTNSNSLTLMKHKESGRLRQTQPTLERETFGRLDSHILELQIRSHYICGCALASEINKKRKFQNYSTVISNALIDKIGFLGFVTSSDNYLHLYALYAFTLSALIPAHSSS